MSYISPACSILAVIQPLGGNPTTHYHPAALQMYDYYFEFASSYYLFFFRVIEPVVFLLVQYSPSNSLLSSEIFSFVVP